MIDVCVLRNWSVNGEYAHWKYVEYLKGEIIINTLDLKNNKTCCYKQIHNTGFLQEFYVSMYLSLYFHSLILHDIPEIFFIKPKTFSYKTKNLNLSHVLSDLELEMKISI